MKKIKTITGAVICIFLSGCAAHTYVYNLQLKQPVISDTLRYENDTMIARFTFKETSLNFLLENKLNQGIKINWDEASLSVNGKSYRIVHKETGSYKTTDLQPPTVIAPHSYLDDYLIPTDNVYHASIYGKPYIFFNKLFPYKDYGHKDEQEKILNMQGKTVFISMPFYVNNIYVPKTFEIYIKAVTPKK